MASRVSSLSPSRLRITMLAIFAAEDRIAPALGMDRLGEWIIKRMPHQLSDPVEHVTRLSQLEGPEVSLLEEGKDGVCWSSGCGQ